MPDDSDAALLQNLADAGCCGEFSRKCGELMREGRSAELLALLCSRRAELLDAVHDGQDRLDCLDYLIFQLKKEGKKHEIR